jgi:hypothetical protein
MNILFFIILFILLLSLKCNNNFEFYNNQKDKDMKMEIKRELDKKYPHTAKLVQNIGNITSEIYQYYNSIKFDKRCINKNLKKSKNKLDIQDFLNLTNNCKIN